MQVIVFGLSGKMKLLDLSRVEVPYGTAWKWQQSLLDLHMNLQDGVSSDSDGIVGHLLIMQHKSVYTLGSQTQDDWLHKTNKHWNLEYETFHVERGGQATYHGPGQLVMYPIMDLNYFERDINLYLRGLEDIVIHTVKDFGVNACRQEGLTGVWVGDKKISAIGIKLRRWVTMHGLSLNVNPDIRYFDNIIPCGITDKAVGRLVDFNSSANIVNTANGLLSKFQQEFDVEYTHDFPFDFQAEKEDIVQNYGINTGSKDDYQECCVRYLDNLVAEQNKKRL